MYEDSRFKKFYPIFICLILAAVIVAKFFFSLNLFKSHSGFITGDAHDAYLLKAIEITNGDWQQMKTHLMGWPILMAPFFSLFEFENNFEYMPVQMALSLIFSLMSVPLVYLLARYFVNRPAAISAGVIYAFLPQLVQNSIEGLSEPSFMFFTLLAFLFLLRADKIQHVKSGSAVSNLFLAFFFAGVANWIRANGIAFLVAFLIITLFIFKMKKKDVGLASFGFFILFAPYALQRYLQFGSIFDYGAVSRYFHQNFNTIWAENVTKISLSEFIKNNNIKEVLFFLWLGIKKFLIHLKLLLFPVIILFLPVGIFVAAKRRSSEIITLVIFSVLTLSLVFLIYPAQGSERHIFFLLPFIIVLAALGFDEMFAKRFNWAGLMLLVGIFMVSFINLQLYFYSLPKINQSQLGEQIQEGQYLAYNLKGKVTNNLPFTRLFVPGVHYLKNTDNSTFANENLILSYLYAENFADFLSDAKKYHFDLVFMAEKNTMSFLDDVYANETRYTDVLTKVYDSKYLGLKLVKSKVFKIY